MRILSLLLVFAISTRRATPRPASSSPKDILQYQMNALRSAVRFNDKDELRKLYFLVRTDDQEVTRLLSFYNETWFEVESAWYSGKDIQGFVHYTGKLDGYEKYVIKRYSGSPTGWRIEHDLWKIIKIFVK